MATLLDLKTRALRRADMVNSQFIEDAELLEYINASYAELRDLIIQTNEDYYTTSTTFTLTTGDAGVYELPANFVKLRGLDYQLGGDYVTVYPYKWNERNHADNSLLLRGGLDRSYRIMGSNLRIEPRSNATGDYQLWYVPAITPLALDADVVETVITRNGWEEYIVVDVAMKMLDKEESDIRSLMTAKALLTRRIEVAAGDRDIDQPESVSDTSRRSGRDGFHRW